MIKRLLKKSSEQLVKKFEYHKVSLQKELEERQRQHQARLRAEGTHHMTDQLSLPPSSSSSSSPSYPKSFSIPPNYASHHYRHPHPHLHNGMYPRGPHPSYPPHFSQPMSLHPPPGGSPVYHRGATPSYILPSHLCPPPYHSSTGTPARPMLPPPPPSLPLSPPPPPSHVTSTTVRSNDVYDGSEETFV